MILPCSGGLVDFSLAVDAVIHEDVTPTEDTTPPLLYTTLLTQRNASEKGNLIAYLWVTFTEFGYPTAFVSSASISSEPSSDPSSYSGSSGL